MYSITVWHQHLGWIIFFVKGFTILNLQSLVEQSFCEVNGNKCFNTISAAVFQVCIQNRYKLNKKLRKYLSQTNSNANLLEDKSLLNQHKVCHTKSLTDQLQRQPPWGQVTP